MNKKLEFGKKMKEARTEQGKTQADCAIHCGVCLETYQRWEWGLSMPKNDKLENICDFLGMRSESWQ